MAVSVSPLILRVRHLVLAAAVPSLRPAAGLGLAVAGGHVSGGRGPAMEAGGHVATRASRPPLLGHVSLVVPGAAQTLLPPAAYYQVDKETQEISCCQPHPHLCLASRRCLLELRRLLPPLDPRSEGNTALVSRVLT